MNSPDAFLKYALCFSIMFMLTWISKLNKSNRLFDTKGMPAANIHNLIGLHCAGILWLGLVPMTDFNRSLTILVLGNGSPAFVRLILFIFLAAIISHTGLRASRQVHIHYELQPASNKFLLCYFPARILFLCAYELFFRGFLLFDGMKWFGILPAMLLTTGLTVLIHAFTNKKERWACIPFGMILSGCCITMNAVWPAMVLHLALSLSYEVPVVTQFLTPLKLSK